MNPKTKPLPKRAVKYLRAVQRKIKSAPKLFNQDRPVIPECGSPGCILGFLAAEVYKRNKHSLVRPDNQSLLRRIGININQARLLFNASEWPGKLCRRWFENSPTPKMAIQRIDKFIETRGEQ